MAWEERLAAVLDELEQQAEAAYDAEREVDLADRARAEYRSVTLASRLVASVGSQVVVDVDGPGRVAGELRRVGEGWLLLRAALGEWVVPLDAVRGVGGASARSVPEVAWSPLARLGLGSALRRLADSEEACLVHLRGDHRAVGGVLEVVLVRVGADFCEARDAAGRSVLVPFGALGAVQAPEPDQR